MLFQTLLTFCPVPIVISMVSQVIDTAYGEKVIWGIDVKMESPFKFSLLKVLEIIPWT